MFRDECEIRVAGGKGGDGLVSFRREARVPKGGPDGGDGGDGGAVVLMATSRVNSLLLVGRVPRYEAPPGQPGGPAKRTGRTGSDVVVEVPLGTQVFDGQRGNLLRDLTEEGQRLVVAAGGRGGRGNPHFATAVRQAPRKAESGRPGEVRRLRLELKLFAEVGLVGLPNAGKSTFLAAISRARPKIADYPFTTLEPEVGIAAVEDYDTLVVADLPGLIEGAAMGHGLGHRFLKHVERCRVLVHLVDVSHGDGAKAAAAFRAIEAELKQYSEALFERPRLAVASKVESPEAEAAASEWEAQLGAPIHRISSHTGRGVAALLAAAQKLVRQGGHAGPAGA